jgi:hypothetical protein
MRRVVEDALAFNYLLDCLVNFVLDSLSLCISAGYWKGDICFTRREVAHLESAIHDWKSQLN